MMKKICFFTVLIMFLAVNSVFAVDISRHETTNIVYMEGSVNGDSFEGRYVTVLIKDNEGEIAYIGQCDLDENGKYHAKFRLDNALGELTYSVREGAGAVAAVDVVSVTAQPVVIDLKIADAVSGGKYITEDAVVEAVATVKNKYAGIEEFKLILAFYDENGELIDCQFSQKQETSFDDIETKKTFSYGTIPVDTAKVKAFVWSDEVTLVPMGETDETELNNRVFGDESKETVVAFLGDSISHQGQQQKFIETYYKTKYPNRKIQFLNKGINGDIASGIVNRFENDVVGNEFTQTPDSASLMIGMNDIQRYLYEGDYTDEKKQAEIDSSLSNIEGIIELCKENNITLTLVTPSLYDEGNYTNADANIAVGANAALGKIGAGMKALAEKYNLSVIDLNTATTNWTTTIRANENWKNDAIIVTTDRIHPNVFGGFVMGYEYVKQQGNSAVVASVEINAELNSVNMENANVANLSIADDSVSYTYIPKSLPMAYTNEYIKAEEYGIPVTDDINNEIVKVTGLADGEYVISMNGTTLTDIYSADELATGVNIATDANNPGQISAKAVDKKVKEKIALEYTYRSIPFMESIADRYGFDMTNETEVNAWIETTGSNQSFYQTHYKRYKELKPKQTAAWQEIETLDAEAKALSQTSAIEVIIKKQ